MLYEIRMDDEEAHWVVDLFKRIQVASAAGLSAHFAGEDIERMESFISRIRARTRRHV